MTIIDVGNEIYLGLSSDTKQSTGIPGGSLFIETDTGKIYGWSGSTWVLAGGGAGVGAVLNNQNNALGAFYEDLTQITTPSNPASGTRRIYVNSGTGAISSLDSAGTVHNLESPAGGSTLPNIVTVAPSGGQFTTLQAAIGSLGANPTIIQVAPGTYSTSSAQLPVLTKSNITIQGSGQGITNIVADASVTGDTPILDIHGSTNGSSLSLTANTNPGDTSLTISSANATTLNTAGAQYILIRSNRHPDTEFPAINAGEILKIKSINTGTGVISLTDELNDAYLTSDSASCIQVIPVSHITVSGISFSSVAATSGRNAGFIFTRFLTDFTMSDCEVFNGYWAGLQMSSCLNSRVQSCFMHDIQDPAGAGLGSTHYGVVIHAASKNIVVDTCQFSTLRHSVTMGGQTGTNFEGVVRNVTVTNCTSETTDTAHFDTHQAAENIVFSSCTCVGGVPQSGNVGVYGYQVRSPKTTIVGGMILRPKTKAIYIFGNGSGTVISGCQINSVKQFSGAGGDAIQLDPSITDVLVENCRIKDCDAHAFAGNGSGNHDCSFVGNNVTNCSLVSGDGNIRFDGSNNGIVNANRFKGGPNRPVQTSGTSDKWIVTSNSFTGMGNTANSLTGANNVQANNTT